MNAEKFDFATDAPLSDGAQHYVRVTLREGKLSVSVDVKEFQFKPVNAGQCAGREKVT